MTTFSTSEPYLEVSEVPDDIISKLDAIIVLGGGVGNAINSPPPYVQDRCERAASIFQRAVRLESNNNVPVMIALSAGTAHFPQLMSDTGLPIWESTVSAAYLMEKLHIPAEKVFVETTSYDTISNAYFTRTGFTDITGWSNLLIVTDEFHMERSKAIFDWVFSAKQSQQKQPQYQLHYLAAANRGLSNDALVARRKHEKKGFENVKKLATEYPALTGVWEFLTSKHTFYNAHKLVELGKTKVQDDSSKSLLIQSYGVKAAHPDKPILSSSDKFPHDSSKTFYQGLLLGVSLSFIATLFINTKIKAHVH